jgi:hypothetical protein
MSRIRRVILLDPSLMGGYTRGSSLRIALEISALLPKWWWPKSLAGQDNGGIDSAQGGSTGTQGFGRVEAHS